MKGNGDRCKSGYVRGSVHVVIDNPGWSWRWSCGGWVGLGVEECAEGWEWWCRRGGGVLRQLWMGWWLEWFCAAAVVGGVVVVVVECHIL